jgi:hypothetical protein
MARGDGQELPSICAIQDLNFDRKFTPRIGGTAVIYVINGIYAGS